MPETEVSKEYTLIKNTLTEEPKSVNELIVSTSLPMGTIMAIIHRTNKENFYIRCGKVHLKKQKGKGKGI